jgi:AraC-like DNA-binding protein
VGFLQRHQNPDGPRVRQRALHRPATESADRLGQVDHKDFAREVRGDRLEFVEAPRGARPYRSDQIAWYARRVELAREMLATRFAEPLSLDRVAREAGMSPFHFSRVFRELVGMPPHRYLLRIRLLRAAQRLRAGDGVTETCLATGFNNLSHFIRTFHRVLGVPPSRFGA